MSITSPAAEQLEQELRSACSDLGRRLRAGERCSAEEYLAQHPAIAANPDLAIELIYTEYVVRVELNQHVSCDDWLTRFPQWRNDLQQLIEVHQQVCGDVFDKSTVIPERHATVAVPGVIPTMPDGVGPDSPAARRVGNYELLGELGRGGMGVIYRARQIGLNRLVALKMVLSGEFAGPRELARFQRESEAAARLHHANIVQIYEVGAHEGRPYFSMELVDGGRLDEQLSRELPTPRQSAALLLKLARAAHYAHQRGVVHRDLKPGNILLANCDANHGVAFPLGSNGTGHVEPKISDFGLAKRVVEGNDQHTRSGAVVGTPSYMAPEQARGRSAEIGPAADIYSLGAILYELLTRRPPFLAGTPLDTLRQAQHDDPAAPSRLRSSVPRDLDTICLKCLEKDPGRRYATAEALAADLQRFLGNEPIAAKAVGVVERLSKWTRRRPALAGLIASLAIGFVSVLGLWRTAESRRGQALASLDKAEQARAAAQQARDGAEQSRTIAIDARENAEHQLYFNRIALALSDWQSYRVARADQILESCPPRFRHWEWDYLKGVCNSQVRTFRGHSDLVSSIAISPNGKFIASGTGEWGWSRAGEVILWDFATGESIYNLRGHTGQISAVAFSPDSKLLVSTSIGWQAAGRGAVKVWNLSGEELYELPAPAKEVYALAFAQTPNGPVLAAGGLDGLISLWSMSESGPVLCKTLEGHSTSTFKNVFSLDFSPDGKRLASAGRDGSWRIWNLESGEQLFVKSDYGDLRCVAFSPDGRYIAFNNFGSDLWVWDITDSPVEKATYHFPSLPIREFSFSPDGRRILVTGRDGSVMFIDFATGQELKRLHTHNGVVSSGKFSPDGLSIATAGSDRTIKLWDAKSDWNPEAIRMLSGFAYNVVFTPDGNHCLLPNGYNRASPSRGERTALVWDVEQSRVVKTLTGHTGWLNDAAVSSDGSRWATASDDKTVRIWDPETGETVRMLVGHTGPVHGVAFRPNSEQVATASADGSVRLWNSDTGEMIAVLNGHTGRVHSVAYSVHGRWLASAGADKTVRVWDVESATERFRLSGHASAVERVAFCRDPESPDLLASAGDDEMIRFWNAASGELVRELRGHSGAVTGVSFSPDGKRLASSSSDLTVKLWDVSTGSEIVTLGGRNTNSVLCVNFSPDGKRLAAITHATMLLWNSEPQPPSPREASAYEQANINWHDREAKKCDANRQFAAAAFHWGSLIRYRPTRGAYYNRRGIALASLRDWDGAAVDFAKVIELGATSLSAIEHVALAQLARGQYSEYRDACQRMIDSINDSSKPGEINDAVWYSSIAPDAVDQPSRLAELAERSLASVAEKQRQAYLNTLGAALCRANRLDEAIDALNQSMAAQGSGGIVEDWLFLALTYHKLGQSDRAREWYDKSAEWLANNGSESSAGREVTSWDERLAREQLCREIGALLNP